MSLQILLALCAVLSVSIAHTGAHPSPAPDHRWRTARHLSALGRQKLHHVGDFQGWYCDNGAIYDNAGTVASASGNYIGGPWVWTGGNSCQQVSGMGFMGPNGGAVVSTAGGGTYAGAEAYQGGRKLLWGNWNGNNENWNGNSNGYYHHHHNDNNDGGDSAASSSSSAASDGDGGGAAAASSAAASGGRDGSAAASSSAAAAGR